MKAEDLRIGNWYWWEAEGKKYPLQVSKKDFCNQNHLNFDPIPLTEEWLKRFGFYNSNDFYIKHEWFCSVIRVAEYYHVLLRKDNFHLTSIDYVHQLQNLYHALTGNELQIQK